MDIKQALESRFHISTELVKGRRPLVEQVGVFVLSVLPHLFRAYLAVSHTQQLGVLGCSISGSYYYRCDKKLVGAQC